MHEVSLSITPGSHRLPGAHDMCRHKLLRRSYNSAYAKGALAVQALSTQFREYKLIVFRPFALTCTNCQMAVYRMGFILTEY